MRLTGTDRRTDGQTCVLGGCASKNGAWTDAVLVQILYNLTGTWGNDLCNICCVYANIFLPLTQFCKYISLVEEKDDTGIKEHFAVGNHVEQLENKEDKKTCFCNNRILEKVVYLDSFMHFIHF